MLTKFVTRLLGRLKIWQKIALIGFVFTIPLALTMYYLLDEKNYKIDFAQWELYGDEYLRPASDLLESVLTHKSLSRQKLAGDATVKGDLVKLEARIASEMRELEEVDARLSGPLKTGAQELEARNRASASPRALRGTWDQVQKASDPKLDEELHVKLIADLRTLISHVGDSSKLILDPDLDTYYLMDALLLKEPDIIDRTNQMGDEVAQILARKAVTLEERETLAGEVALLRAGVDGLKTDIETAVTESVNFSHNHQLGPVTTPEVMAVAADMDAVISLTIDRVVRPAIATVEPAEYA